MSEESPGEGWWIASDGEWYAPELHPDFSEPSDLIDPADAAEPDDAADGPEPQDQTMQPTDPNHRIQPNQPTKLTQ